MPDLGYISWWRPLSEPVRQKHSVRPGANQFFAIDTMMFIRTPPRMDSWYKWFSEPVRQKLGLLSGLHQFFAIDTLEFIATPPRVDSWIYALSEPVRIKIWLKAAHYPFFETDWEWSVPVPFFHFVMTEIGDSPTLTAGIGRLQGGKVSIIEIAPNLGNVAITQVRTV